MQFAHMRSVDELPAAVWNCTGLEQVVQAVHEVETPPVAATLAAEVT